MKKIFLLIIIVSSVCQLSAKQDKSSVYSMTTTPPSFPGGEEAMTKYIKSRLVYPYKAIEAEIQGKVLVGFKIDSFGYINNIRIIEGIYPACDSLALDIIENMPRWIPGISEPDMEFNLPVVFKPQFPGGMDSMFQFINRNLKYPVMGDCSIQGRVIIRFIVTKEGKVKDPVIMRSLERSFDNEALRVIDMMPDWEPAIHNGEKVDCYFTLPILFRILN